MNVSNTDGQLHGVDIIKFVMAFAVIIIHVTAVTHYDSAMPPALGWFIRLAVPFYFICSGFLVMRGAGADAGAFRRRLRKKAVRLYRIFGYWLLIYLPITLYECTVNSIPLWKDVVGYFINLFILGESSYAWPLWFVYSMVIVFSLLSLSVGRRWLFILLAVLLAAVPAVVWANGYFHNTFTGIFTMLTARPLGGGVYILAGMMCWRVEMMSKTLSFLTAAVVSVVLFWLGAPYWELAGGVALFCFARQVLPWIGGQLSCPVCMWMRRMSMWIYYLHMYPIFITLKMCSLLHLRVEMWPMFVWVSFCVVVVSALLVRLSGSSSRFRHLRILVGG